MWPFGKKTSPGTRGADGGNAPKASHMALLSPGSHKEHLEHWATGCRNTTIELKAEIFEEDFPLQQLPKGWDVCPYIDEQDGRILFAGNGIAFAFSYGAIVYVGIESSTRHEIADSLRQSLRTGLSARITSERFHINVKNESKPAVLHNAILVGELTPSRLVTIVITLAQSVAMEYYETLVRQARDETLNILIEQRKRGRVSTSSKRLAKQVATATLMEAEVVGVLHLLDKPESIWDDPEMDAIYEDLRATFDLNERFKSIEYKVDIVRESMRIISDTRRSQMALRLEAAVTLFVFIEVVLSLGSHFHWFGL